MYVCEKHRNTPARGYSPCLGCELEILQAQAAYEADCMEAYKAEAQAMKSEIERLRYALRELWATQDPEAWEETFAKAVSELCKG